MMSKETLIKSARLHSYKPEILEKVLKLLEVLGQFSSVPFLNERLALNTLKKVAAEKREKSIKAALSAIKEMQQNGVPITFSSVAKLAGLSTMYLYKNPVLCEKIKELRHINKLDDLKENLNQKITQHEITIKELKNTILSKNFEIKRLKKQLEVVYGELYRKG